MFSLTLSRVLAWTLITIIKLSLASQEYNPELDEDFIFAREKLGNLCSEQYLQIDRGTLSACSIKCNRRYPFNFYTEKSGLICYSEIIMGQIAKYSDIEGKGKLCECGLTSGKHICSRPYRIVRKIYASRGKKAVCNYACSDVSVFTKRDSKTNHKGNTAVWCHLEHSEIPHFQSNDLQFLVKGRLANGYHKCWCGIPTIDLKHSQVNIPDDKEFHELPQMGQPLFNGTAITNLQEYYAQGGISASHSRENQLIPFEIHSVNGTTLPNMQSIIPDRHSRRSPLSLFSQDSINRTAVANAQENIPASLSRDIYLHPFDPYSINRTSLPNMQGIIPEKHSRRSQLSLFGEPSVNRAAIANVQESIPESQSRDNTLLPYDVYSVNRTALPNTQGSIPESDSRECQLSLFNQASVDGIYFPNEQLQISSPARDLTKIQSDRERKKQEKRSHSSTSGVKTHSKESKRPLQFFEFL